MITNILDHFHARPSNYDGHFHGVFLEGGFDNTGDFIFIPIHDTGKLCENFRQMVIKYFLSKGLITKYFAQMLLGWKHSGFSIKSSFRIYGQDTAKMEARGLYLTRSPISLQKLSYIKSKGNVIMHTEYNQYLKENLKLYKAEEFIKLLVQQIPPSRLHYVRYYGLYSSRSRSKWKDMPHVLRLAPSGWNTKQDEQPEEEIVYDDNTVGAKAKRSAWARLIKKVYEVNPLVCNKCGSEMRVMAVITDKAQVTRILRHLCKIGRAPSGLTVSDLQDLS